MGRVSCSWCSSDCPTGRRTTGLSVADRRLWLKAYGDCGGQERDGRRADVAAEFIRRSFFPPFSYSTLSRTMNHNHNHPPTTRLLLLHTEYYRTYYLICILPSDKQNHYGQYEYHLYYLWGYQYHYHRPRRIIATTFHFGRDKKYL